MEIKGRFFNKAMMKKREEKEEVKETFVDSGNFARMQKTLNEKRNKKIDPKTLPF
jgi:hypothetical protein